MAPYSGIKRQSDITMKISLAEFHDKNTLKYFQ